MSQNNNNKKIYIAVISVIVVVFTFLKIKYLLNVPLWHDEGLTLMHIQAKTFSDMLNSISLYEQNPFLFFLFERFFTGATGSYSHLILRLIPFIFSIMSPFALYYLFKISFRDEKGAMIAGTFLYISEFFTFMTCDARGYSQAIFFIIMGMIYYQKLVQKEKLSFVLFFVFWILALFSHYLALVTLVIILIHYLIFNRGKNDVDLLTACGLIFFTFIPEGLRILVIMKNPVFLPGPARFADILELFYASLTGFTLEFPHMAVWYSLCIISIIMVFASLFVKDVEKEKVYLYLAVFLGVFLSIFIPAKFFNIRVFSSRHLILVLPFYSMLIALSLSRIKIRFLPYILLTVVVVVNFLSTYNAVFKDRYHRNDFRAVASILKTQFKENDAVMLIHGYQKPLLFYYFPQLKKENFISIEKGDPTSFNLKRLNKFNRIWLILSDPFQVDPKMELTDKINSRYKYIGSYQVKKANMIYTIYVNLYEVGEGNEK